VYRDIPDDLRELIEPVVADHGCELVDVDDVRGSGGGVLRITIDRAEGDGQVSLDGCAEISREIESQLDAADVCRVAIGWKCRRRDSIGCWPGKKIFSRRAGWR
jgi:ribosome maturation factor RimP